MKVYSIKITILKFNIKSLIILKRENDLNKVLDLLNFQLQTN